MSTRRLGWLSLAALGCVCGGIGLIRHAQMGRLSLWIHVAALTLGLFSLFMGTRSVR